MPERKPLERMEEMLRNGASRFDKLEERLESVERSRKTSFPGKPAKEADKFSFTRLIRGVTSGRWKGCEFERDECERAEEDARKRDLSYGTPSAGGYIVPEQYVASLIDSLNAQSVVLQSGATQITGLTTPIKLRRRRAMSRPTTRPNTSR